MMPKAWMDIEEEVPDWFTNLKFQGRGGKKNRQIWPDFSVSRL